MGEVLVFLLLGVGAGALISGTGIGVVLSYRGSGVINLAVGAMAMLSGYFFWSLRTGYFGPTLATAPAVVLTLAFALVLGAVFELIVIYPLRNAAPLAKLVASLGFLIAAMAAVSLAFGTGPKPQPAILPVGRFDLYDQPLLLNRFLIFAIVLAIALVLIGVDRLTRFGVGTRATAENELHATLAGLSPRWISLANTILMSELMAVLGLCAASIQVLDPVDLPLLVVPGLAAAMFASMRSIAIAFIAGTIMGALESLLVYASTQAWFPTTAPGAPIPGVQEMLIFIILVFAVWVRGGRLPARGELATQHLPPVFRPSRPLRSALIYGAIGALCLWLFPGVYRSALVTSLMWAVLGLSIVLITGFVGQVSAAQLALGCTAGFVAGEAAMHLGIGFPLDAFVGVVGATLLGFLLALPALRVRGVSLVIVTLAAAVALSDFVFANPKIDQSAFFLMVPKAFGFVVSPIAPIVFDGDVPSYLFAIIVLGVAILAGLLVCNVRRSSVGRQMLAVRSNERAAAAVGINVRNVKILTFTLAAAIAGVAGILLSYAYGPITLGGIDTVTTLSLIAFAYIGGITTVPGAFLAGLLLTGNFLTVCLQRWLDVPPDWTTLGAGLLLVVVLVALPEGLAGPIFYGSRTRRSAVTATRPASAPSLLASEPES